MKEWERKEEEAAFEPTTTRSLGQLCYSLSPRNPSSLPVQAQQQQTATTTQQAAQAAQEAQQTAQAAATQASQAQSQAQPSTDGSLKQIDLTKLGKCPGKFSGESDDWENFRFLFS